MPPAFGPGSVVHGRGVVVETALRPHAVPVVPDPSLFGDKSAGFVVQVVERPDA
jgi:hypothetical protein